MTTFQTQFLVFMGLTLMLLRVPVAGKYVALLNTLVHEVGHAVVALLTGGRVAKIELFANSEGTAWSSHRFWFGRILTSLAGYPAASAAAYLSVWLIVNGKTEWFLTGLLGVFLVSALLWIRNLTGILWVVVATAALGYLLYTDHPEIMTTVALVLASILLASSLSSAFDILKISVKTPFDSGDAKNLQKATLIPAPVWGLLFFSQALMFTGISIYRIYTA